MLCGRINRIERELRWMIVGETRLQSSIAQGIRCDEHWQDGNATRIDGGITQKFGIVDAQGPRRLDPVVAVFSGQFPLVARGEEAVGETVMIPQIAWMFRYAVTL